MQKMRLVPGIVDLRIQQPFDAPRLTVDVDRVRAQELGYTPARRCEQPARRAVRQRPDDADVLAGPEERRELPRRGAVAAVHPRVAPGHPEHPGDGLERPAAADPRQPRLDPARRRSSARCRTTTRSPSSTSTAACKGATSARSPARSRKLVDAARKDLPRGSQMIVRGQILTMRTSFTGLLAGLLFSIVLVYLLIVVNFQSWLDPFIIISALPAAIAGIVWMLFLVHTTISVPSLTGAIMCMGVATANSILVVSFAKEQLHEGKTAVEAAEEAGFTRFRPVLMTALAMIIGMVPMALGLGEGGEQNAPLGRAVIGGLLFATVATLFFVPTFFSIVHGREKARAPQSGDVAL